MNTEFVTIIKRIIAEQGEAILGDPQRLKSFVKDYAAAENKQERAAFGRCIEYGAYTMLKKTAPQNRAAAKDSLAQRVHGNTGTDIALCGSALDALEAALFGSVSGQQPQSAHQSRQYPQPAPQSYQPSYFNPPQTPYRAKRKNKTGIVIAALAAVILIIWGVSSYMGGANPQSSLDWEGYTDFESFSEAANVDEIFGYEITEEALTGIMITGAVFFDEIKLDLVSGDILTEKYKVPVSMWEEDYDYLIGKKGSTVYLAMSLMLDRWGMVIWSME